MALRAALRDTDTPPVWAAVFGPAGMVTAVEASPSTWTSGSPPATDRPPLAVQPVRELVPVPVQVISDPEVRSSNWPAPTVSAPEPRVVTAIVVPLVVAPLAKVSGSVPTDWTA